MIRKPFQPVESAAADSIKFCDSKLQLICKFNEKISTKLSEIGRRKNVKLWRKGNMLTCWLRLPKKKDKSDSCTNLLFAKSLPDPASCDKLWFVVSDEIVMPHTLDCKILDCESLIEHVCALRFLAVATKVLEMWNCANREICGSCDGDEQPVSELHNYGDGIQENVCLTWRLIEWWRRVWPEIRWST